MGCVSRAELGPIKGGPEDTPAKELIEPRQPR